MMRVPLLLALCGARAFAQNESKPFELETPWSDAKSIALAEAIERDDANAIDALIADGADANAVGKNQITPLVWAIVQEKKRAFRSLLAQGADLNHRDESGQTPLIVAATHHKFDLVDLLLKAGADYRKKDDKGEDLPYLLVVTSTGVLWPAQQSRERVLEWLIDRGVSFDDAESRFAGGNWDKNQLRDWWREQGRWALRCVASDPQNARGFRILAGAQMVKNDYRRCIDDCTEAIRLDPNDAAGYLLRGRAWYQLGHSPEPPTGAYDRATTDFTDAIRMDASRSDGFIGRAMVWEAKGDYAKAITDYSEAITLEPENAVFYWRRAEARLRRASLVSAPDEFEKAVDDCNRAVELDGNDPRVYHARGVARAKLMKSDDAIADQSKAIELDRDYARAYLDRADAWHQKRFFLAKSSPADLGACLDNAIADASEAIRIEPKSAYARGKRGDFWGWKGEYEKALADYTEAIRLDPYISYFDSRAKIWRLKGEYDKAIADYSEAIRLGSTERILLALAYNGRGEARVARKQYEEAVQDFSDAIRLTDNGTARENRRAVWRHTRQFQNILDDLESCAQANPERSFAWRDVAWFLATCPDPSLRDGGKAVGHAMKARELSANAEPEWLAGAKPSPKLAAWLKDSREKGYPDDWATLAAAYAEAGGFDEAIRWQTKAVEVSRSEKESGEHRRRLGLYERHEVYRDADSQDGKYEKQ